MNILDKDNLFEIKNHRPYRAPPRIPTFDMLKAGRKAWEKAPHLSISANILQSYLAMHDYWIQVDMHKENPREIDADGGEIKTAVRY